MQKPTAKLRPTCNSFDKLQQLRYLKTPTAKLRPTCNSFDSSSGYGFLNMTTLQFWGCTSIIEWIDLSVTNIITIPESISRFPRLRRLSIDNCKHLREIQGLPLSIRTVDAYDCPLLDYESSSGLLNQVSLFL